MSEETKDKAAAPAAEKEVVRPDTDRGDGDRDERRRSRRRRKVSYLTINKIEKVDYKEVNILRRFINEHGKMLPVRQTGNTAKQQRMIAKAIRRAREMALLPFVVTEMTADIRPPRVRRPRQDMPPRESAPAPAPEPKAEAPEAKSE